MPSKRIKKNMIRYNYATLKATGLDGNAFMNISTYIYQNFEQR